MAKDKVKDKKEKKEKRSESDGIKKSKKDKKEKKSEHVTEALLASVSDASSGADVKTTVAIRTVADESDDETARPALVSANLVPFAVPLSDDKTTKKIFKSVKKGTLPLCLLRRRLAHTSCHRSL